MAASPGKGFPDQMIRSAKPPRFFRFSRHPIFSNLPVGRWPNVLGRGAYTTSRDVGKFFPDHYPMPGNSSTRLQSVCHAVAATALLGASHIDYGFQALGTG